MRNRAYAPGLGRFLQRDPNQTAMALAESAAMHGRGLGALSLAFDLEGLYGDGGNLYEYLGSNPWKRSDPLGLSWDPFSLVDEYLAEDAGNKAAFLGQIVGAATTVAYLAATITSVLPVPLPVGIAADIAAGALEGHVSPALRQFRKILGYVALAAVTVMVAKVAVSAFRAAARYVARRGVRGVLYDMSMFGLFGRAKQFIERKVRGGGHIGCMLCFTASTVVLTPAGAVPIADVQEGMAVLAAPDTGDGTDPAPAAVAAQLVVSEASLLVTLQPSATA
jgi:hypothetical protein